MSHEQKEAARTQTESRAGATAHEVGLRAQHSKVSERKQNPQFYDKFTKSSLEDSEKWSHLLNEHGAWMADDHILANQRPVFRLQREMLNQTRAEQAIVGASPGLRLKQKPLLNALAQGVHPRLDEFVSFDAAGQSMVEINDPSFSPPMSAEERTVMDDLASLATARQSMGVDQAGSEALTTATSESRTVRNDETEKNSRLSSIAGAFD